MWAALSSQHPVKTSSRGGSEDFCFLRLVVLIGELREPQLGRVIRGLAPFGQTGEASQVESTDWKH